MQKPVEALASRSCAPRRTIYAAFMKVDGAARQLVQQHRLRRRRRATSPTCIRSSFRGATTASTTPKPVDGADPATDWQGLHALDEAPHLLNPPNGWIMNTNDWPYSAAGPDSPKREDYPRYMDTAGENPRGVHATLLLRRNDFTPDSLNAAAFDTYLPAFARLIPCWSQPTTPCRRRAAEGQARRADRSRFAAGTTAGRPTRSRRRSRCSGATFYGARSSRMRRARSRRSTTTSPNARPPEQKLARARRGVRSARRTTSAPGASPWGEINRFQRLTRRHRASISTTPRRAFPIPFTSATLGLARILRRAALRGHHANTTAPAATALSRSSSSASGCRRGRSRRRRKRRSRLAALQRPGGALRRRRPARGLLLSVTA